MFSLFGSADGVVNMLVPALQALLVRGVLPAAVSLGATLLDEGTETGLVKLLRPALAARHPDALRVMGVVRQCTCAARLLDLWLVLLLVCAALHVSLTVCVLLWRRGFRGNKLERRVEFSHAVCGSKPQRRGHHTHEDARQ